MMANEKRLIKPETIKLELAFIGCEPKHLAAVDRCAIVDAVEVVHGRWIKRTSYPIKYVCSECGHLKEFAKPYCELCGAKMDGGNEDG